MQQEPSLNATREYYDDFAGGYERARRPNDPGGYHALVDDLEVDLVRRYGVQKEVLECGCGTGLILERIAEFARCAKGVDLSPGMLVHAQKRGLDVAEASVTKLPFDDETFDVTCSFKVLAHVPDIGGALNEMARVTRRGGVILAEFYNPLSFRALAKVLTPAGKVSSSRRESDVYTRFDAPWVIPRLVPAGVSLEAVRGVRILTPAALFFRLPMLRTILREAETRLADSKIAYFGGFYVAVLRKRP